MSTVIILGAGPAGLAAGYELVKLGQRVIILEKENKVGGLARTDECQGNLFDIGPHRFFTKNEEVQKFWEDMLGQDLLKRPRLTRIYYHKKYFYYPLKLGNALGNLGFFESLKIFFSLITVRLERLIRKNKITSFEDWVVSRFGRRLFNHFFKSYTEKLWGVSTSEISAEWSAQRLQAMSLVKVLKSFIFKPKAGSVKSWVEKFYYPSLGAGQLYEKIAEFIEQHGGKILLNTSVKKIITKNKNQIMRVVYEDSAGDSFELSGEYFINTTPINVIMKIWDSLLPAELVTAVNNLKFRSTIFVNLVVKREKAFPDNWLYIHEPEVSVLRITNTGSFSGAMTMSGQTILSMEYVCNLNDSLWLQSEVELLALGRTEIQKLGLINQTDILGGKVIKAANTYPVYVFNYKEDITNIFKYLSTFKNFQTIGRAGMFRYNNMDHSILTGFYAARNIMGGNYNIFDINVDDEYHEESK